MTERRPRLRNRYALPFLAVVAAAAGCGESDKKPTVTFESPAVTGTTPAQTAEKPTSNPKPPKRAHHGVRFTFEDLDGGSPTIAVYRDPSDTRAGRESALEEGYKDGKAARALCKTTGRMVVSQVQAGEAYREPSDQWLKISETEYATVIYTNLSETSAHRTAQALASIAVCPEER